MRPLSLVRSSSIVLLMSLSSFAIAGPLPAPGEDTSVSLEEILAYAEEHAPDIISAKSRVQISAALFEGAKIKYPGNPEVGVAIGPRLGGDGASFDLELSLSQSLEINGQRSYRKKAAERYQEIALAEVDEVRWIVHSRVHQAFHEALIAREHKLAAERLVTFTQELLEIANKRLRAGDVSSLAVKISEVDVSQAKQNKIQADSDYRIACISLAEVAGWPVTKAPEPEGGLDVPQKAPAFEVLLALAIKNHPKLKTQASIITAADAQFKLAEIEAKPKPHIGLSFTQESGVFGESLAMLQFGTSFARYQTNQVERTRTKAERGAAEVELETIKKNLEGKIARGIESVGSASDRIALYGAEIIPTFEKNLALLKKSFELGEIDILQISVARERFLELERQSLDAFADYYRAVAELEEELGAEIWPDEKHPIQ